MPNHINTFTRYGSREGGNKSERKITFHMNKDRINYLWGKKLAVHITKIPHTPSHFEKISLTPHNY